MATIDEVTAEQSVVTVTNAVVVRCGARALASKMASAAPKRMIWGSKAHQLTDGPTNPRICRAPISGRPRFRDFRLQLRELLHQAERSQSDIRDVISGRQRLVLFVPAMVSGIGQGKQFPQ